MACAPSPVAAEDEVPSIEEDDLDFAEARIRIESTQNHLQMASVAAIASGLVVVRSQQLKHRAQELIKDFDEIQRLKTLRDDVNRAAAENQRISASRSAIRADLERLSALERSPAGNEASIEALKRKIASDRQVLGELEAKVSHLEARLASQKPALGFATGADHALVSTRINEAQRSLTQRLAALDQSDEFTEALSKVRAGHFDDVAGEVQGSAQHSSARLAAKAKLVRNLGLLGLGASAATSAWALLNTYQAAVDLSTAHERRIDEQYEELERALAHEAID